jgi:hypothetical protein
VCTDCQPNDTIRVDHRDDLANKTTDRLGSAPPNPSPELLPPLGELRPIVVIAGMERRAKPVAIARSDLAENSRLAERGVL